MHTHNAQAGSWDADCVRAAIDGCHDAWTITVDRTRHYLVSFLQSRGATPDEADDLAQLAYCRAWERRAQFTHDDNAPAAFRSWLVQIAVNAWRDEARRRSPVVAKTQQPRKARFVTHCDLTDQQTYDYESASDGWCPETLVVRDEELTDAAAAIARIFARLTDRHREIARHLLHPLETPRSLGVADVVGIARATGLSYDAAKSRVFRTRRALECAARAEGMEVAS